MTNTLSFQLVSRAVGAIFICLVIAFVSLYWAIGRVIDNDMEDDLQEDLVELREVFEKGGDTAVIAEIKREMEGDDPASAFLRLINSSSEIIHSTDTHQWGDIPIEQTLVSDLSGDKIPSDISTFRIQEQETNARIILGSIGADRVIQIGESFENRDDIMELLLSAFALVFVAALPLAGFLGWLATQRATQGIKAVSSAARAIRSGELDTRVSVVGQPNEIQYLASSFNSMADRNDALINEMREMTDNIAHDLRSPLGRIRAIAETSVTEEQSVENYRSSARQSMFECDRLIKLINDSLDIAETEAGVAKLIIEPVDLGELADEACELFEPVAEEKNIELLKAFQHNKVVNGDRHTLLRMLLNLMDNALKYTPAEGRIRVSVDSDANCQYLEVADNGIGIPPQDKNKVFDRFYRCDQSRTDEGSGLGLSFAQAVAKLHGGEIKVLNDPVYSTVFRVSLNGLNHSQVGI